ncbi:hypothetical protein PI124_g12411 [Phytophthora idaei]|nr:hypothetical protein PI124_g12411 [Phytophthora idaei]
MLHVREYLPSAGELPVRNQRKAPPSQASGSSRENGNSQQARGALLGKNRVLLGLREAEGNKTQP